MNQVKLNESHLDLPCMTSWKSGEPGLSSQVLSPQSNPGASPRWRIGEGPLVKRLASYFSWPRTRVGITLFMAELFFKMWLDVLSWTLHSFDHGIHFWWTLFGLIRQLTPVLALYDPFGVTVPLNFDITHSLTHWHIKYWTPSDIELQGHKKGIILHILDSLYIIFY